MEWFIVGAGEFNANEAGLSSVGEGASGTGEWAECGALCGEGDEEVGVTTEEWEIDAVETGLSS